MYRHEKGEWPGEQPAADRQEPAGLSGEAGYPGGEPAASDASGGPRQAEGGEASAYRQPEGENTPFGPPAGGDASYPYDSTESVGQPAPHGAPGQGPAYPYGQTGAPGGPAYPTGNHMPAGSYRQPGYPPSGRRRSQPGRGMRGGVFRIRKPILFAGAAILVVLAVLLTVLVMPKPKKEEGPVFLNEALGVPVRTVLLDAGTPGRPDIKREVRFVVIHETGNPAEGADAKSHSDYLQNGGQGSTSWHYTVDDHEIYHHIPDDEMAFHASSEEGNTYGIGVELCVNADGDFEKTFDNGAKLTACLLRAYDLPADAVRQHGDFTDKNCPETIRDTGRWEEFLHTVETYWKQLGDREG